MQSVNLLFQNKSGLMFLKTLITVVNKLKTEKIISSKSILYSDQLKNSKKVYFFSLW